MKRLIPAAAVAALAVSVLSLGACKKDDANASSAEPDAALEPFATSDTGPPDDAAAPIPAFDFGDGGPDDGAGDATDAGLVPVDKDPGAVDGALLWATDTSGRLVAFREKATSAVSLKLITGLVAGAQGEKILDITYRPSTGKLYGLSNASHLYLVDTATGSATMVGDGTPFTPSLMAQANGFAMNPVADQLRVQTDVDQDLRLDPTTGKVAAVDGTLAFATGDVNFGQSPNLVGTAYTNAVTPAPTTTMLYAIDSTRNLLTRLPSEPDGTVETIGPLGVDFDQAAGFDISKAGVAYAALTVGSETALYTVDLATGTATKKGVIAYPVALTSIAVQP